MLLPNFFPSYLFCTMQFRTSTDEADLENSIALINKERFEFIAIETVGKADT